MDYKADHFSRTHLSGFSTGASTSPVTVGGGDMSIPHTRPGGVGSLALDRRKQINTLLIFNENVTEIVPNIQYRMDFTGGGTSGPLTMLIHLPPGFPKERPSIRIEPLGLHHGWLDTANGNVIGAAGLNNFSAHSDLGRVVQVIKREFELNPAISTSKRATVPSTLHAPVTSSLQTHWTTNSSSHHNGKVTSNEFAVPQSGAYGTHIKGLPNSTGGNIQQYSVAANFQHSQYANNVVSSHNPTAATNSMAITNATGKYKVHPKADVIPEVASLTDSELETLNNSKPALLQFCQNLHNPIMQSIDDDYEKLKDEIKNIADVNVMLTDSIKNRKESLVKHHGEYEVQKSKYDNVRTKAENAKSVYSLANVSRRLEAASIAIEDESEKCADDFLNSGSNVEQFIKDYTSIRTSHIKNKAKFDSVMQQRNSELKDSSSYIPRWPNY